MGGGGGLKYTVPDFHKKKHQMIVSRIQYPAQSVPAINKRLRRQKNGNLYLRQSTPLESEAKKFVELLTATPMPAVLQS